MHRSRILAALGLIIALSACESTKQTLIETNKDLQAFFGTDTANQPARGHEPPSYAEGEELYRRALAHKERGETKEALGVLRRAAELGHRDAAFELGESYRRGIGVEQDLSAAARYYGDAAVAGHADGQYRLAEAFANGLGVERDLSWAVRWYGKAAYQQHAKAQFAYGVLLGTGKGLAKNKPHAYGWLILAEKNGVSRATPTRQMIEKQITAEQRVEMDLWVESFSPQGGDPLTDPSTVLYVQHQLAELGYKPGPEDGILGHQSRTAINEFQRDQGLRNGNITAQFLERLLIESRKTRS